MRVPMGHRTKPISALWASIPSGLFNYEKSFCGRDHHRIAGDIKSQRPDGSSGIGTLTHYHGQLPRSASLRLSRLSGDLSPATKLQLFEDIVDVIFDRRRTHAEGAGNLLIRQTLRYERDNVILTTG